PADGASIEASARRSGEQGKRGTTDAAAKAASGPQEKILAAQESSQGLLVDGGGVESGQVSRQPVAPGQRPIEYGVKTKNLHGRRGPQAGCRRRKPQGRRSGSRREGHELRLGTIHRRYLEGFGGRPTPTRSRVRRCGTVTFLETAEAPARP